MSQEHGGIAMPRQGSIPSNGSEVFAFLELPLDLVLTISMDFLEPASALALSLACKDLSNVLLARSLRRMKRDDRKDFLLLLEKDMNRQRPTYYCDDCVRLHYFNPARDRPGIHLYGDGRLYRDCRRNCVHLPGTGFSFPYHHARLITNQYLYGTPDPSFLANFLIPRGRLQHPPRWTQTWSAKVISGELFLSATHTFCFGGTEEKFRDILDENEYRICKHIGTRKTFTGVWAHWQLFQKTWGLLPRDTPRNFCPPWDPRRVINSFRLEGTTRIPSGSRRLKPCQAEPGSCDFCATDYTTTLQRRFVEGTQFRRREWVLTIVTYHLLGDCRSPSGDKWEAFKGNWFSCFAEPGREEVFGSVPGDVKERWESAA
ncbi:hypothetical protein F5Y06DRAFT_284680 [Hypoxylon sp. FL0890]|nr:hypothetical protein F5Y06DRAFT_284680 [Hypoxylon sp. FL0890]